MPATVVRAEPCGLGLVHLTLDRAVRGHDKPGQVVTAAVEGFKPGYFALANAPGAPAELLVKGGAPLADALIALPVGGKLTLSEAIGRGFQLPTPDAQPLVLLVVGSGLSAVRALVDGEVAAGLRRPVYLLYGTFTLAHQAFPADLARWAAAGVEVVPVLGTPDSGWAGAQGFVQHEALRRGLLGPHTTVVAVGFPDMIEEIRRAADAAGAPSDAVHTNF